MWKGHWRPYHEKREEERLAVKATACREVGEVSERDILMAGALIYWCEGAKDKSYRRSEFVSFINSDPALVALFLRFLRVAGVPAEHIQFRLHIHETADLERATTYWADLADVPSSQFRKPVIKRHKPKTNRRNVVDDYRGCLLITVNQSADLYRRIEGWAFAAMLGQEAALARLTARSEDAMRRLRTERRLREPGSTALDNTG